VVGGLYIELLAAPLRLRVLLTTFGGMITLWFMGGLMDNDMYEEYYHKHKPKRFDSFMSIPRSFVGWVCIPNFNSISRIEGRSCCCVQIWQRVHLGNKLRLLPRRIFLVSSFGG